MDEDEQRIAATELAMLSLAAHLQPKDVQASIYDLTQDLANATGEEERAIILGAIQVLEDGLSRWDEFSAGRVLWGR